MKKLFSFCLLLTAFVLTPFACKDKDFNPATPRSQKNKATDYASSLAYDWVNITHEMVRANSLFGPNAARAFAYVGLSLWEAVYNGVPEAKSMASQIRDYSEAAVIDVNQEYDWGIVLSAVMREVMPEAIDNITNTQRNQIKSLADLQENTMMEKGLFESTREDSKDLGKRIGQKIVQRMKIDGRDIIRNIIPSVPQRDDEYKWYYDKNANPNFNPIEPLWGTLRTFVIDNSQACEADAPYIYSELSNSPFYLEAKEVETIPGTDEQKRIAYHWENGPGRTSGDAGHWMNITTQLLETRNSNLADCAKAYCLAGLTAADAFSAVWYLKYKYYLLRPVTYINEIINPSWKPLISTPPSPEYISGSAVLGGAEPIVLASLFGNVGFTDRTQLGTALYTPYNPPPNAPYILPERNFSSLTKAGEEAAESPIIGGVQFRRASAQGLISGRCIGSSILSKLNFGY